ncbi:MAG: hypothetical protein ACYDC7_04220 [Acidithiobacillus ferrivorans]
MTTPLTGAYGFVGHHVQAAAEIQPETVFTWLAAQSFVPAAFENPPGKRLRHQAHGILNRLEALQAAGFRGSASRLPPRRRPWRDHNVRGKNHNSAMRPMRGKSSRLAENAAPHQCHKT